MDSTSPPPTGPPTTTAAEQPDTRLGIAVWATVAGLGAAIVILLLATHTTPIDVAATVIDGLRQAWNTVTDFLWRMVTDPARTLPQPSP